MGDGWKRHNSLQYHTVCDVCRGPISKGKPALIAHLPAARAKTTRSIVRHAQCHCIACDEPITGPRPSTAVREWATMYAHAACMGSAVSNPDNVNTPEGSR